MKTVMKTRSGNVNDDKVGCESNAKVADSVMNLKGKDNH